jgi:hypothetical protein
LKELRGKFSAGSQVPPARSNAGRAEKFTIMWAEGKGNSRAGQIGLSAVNPGTSFGNDLIEAESQDKLGAQVEAGLLRLAPFRETRPGLALVLSEMPFWNSDRAIPAAMPTLGGRKATAPVS